VASITLCDRLGVSNRASHVFSSHSLREIKTAKLTPIKVMVVDSCVIDCGMAFGGRRGT
jgi:hypothetical protein